jgi:hypothetical protein
MALQDLFPADPPEAYHAEPSRFPLVFMLLVGLVVGGGGVALYAWMWPSAAPVGRITIARLVMRAPLDVCKNLMVTGLRSAGFTEVVPDPGNGVGVGALGGQYAGATLCMPVAGAVAIAISGPDPEGRIARMKALGAAVAEATKAPPAGR